MQEDLVKKVMEEVMKKMGNNEQQSAVPNIPTKMCSLTEFVGTAIGDTIGLVIANLDQEVHKAMGLDPKYRSIGIIGARTGAGPHIFAADEAAKATNVEVLKVELARDTKGGAGHGCLIIFGSEDVSDSRRAVEVTLKELDRTFGDVYANDAGHLEFQYSARASIACNKALGAPIGRAFGITVGAPAAIGVLMADVAVKAANVEVVGLSSPQNGTSFSNETILLISGDSGAVRQSIIAAREVGKTLLESMAGPAPSSTTPYI